MTVETAVTIVIVETGAMHLTDETNVTEMVVTCSCDGCETDMTDETKVTDETAVTVKTVGMDVTVVMDVMLLTVVTDEMDVIDETQL